MLVLTMVHSGMALKPPPPDAPRTWFDLLNFPAGQAAVTALIVAVAGLVTAATGWIRNQQSHNLHSRELHQIERIVQDAIVKNQLGADNHVAERHGKQLH